MAPSGPKEQPKAAPKAKADAKPKAKKEKKVAEEDETPKMQAPDFEAHQELLQKVQDKIDKLQKENAGITAKINERSSGKEEFFAKKAVIRAELDAVSAEMNAVQEQRDQIRKVVGDKKAETMEMKQEMSKMKKSMNFGSAADIDDRIKSIEDKMMHESVSLKQEKDFMIEIKELKKSKPKLAQLGQMQDKLSSADPGMDFKAKSAQLNEQMAQFREKKKGIQERLAELTESRKAQMGDFSEIMEQREGNSKKIAEFIGERSKLRDDFNAAKREFQIYLAEQRRVKQERYAEERKVQQEQYKIRQMEKQIENLDEQPHVAEIVLIEQTVKFCKSLLPKDAADKSAEEKKEVVHNNKDGETVLLKKEDREMEFYYAPTKKGKAAKKAKSEDTSKKTIKHNAETFKLFDTLKLDAPITVADIPPLLEKLAEQMKMYEGKVKTWEENKEEMKRKIKDGIITMEDLEKKDEEAKEAKGDDKAEDKAEDKEEEKEEDAEKAED